MAPERQDVRQGRGRQGERFGGPSRRGPVSLLPRAGCRAGARGAGGWPGVGTAGAQAGASRRRRWQSPAHACSGREQGGRERATGPAGKPGAGSGGRAGATPVGGGCCLCGSGWSLAKPCGFDLMSLSLVCARPRQDIGTANTQPVWSRLDFCCFIPTQGPCMLHQFLEERELSTVKCFSIWECFHFPRPSSCSLCI